MHPILFRLGPWEVRGYGLMLALSFLLGAALVTWRAHRAGLEPSRALWMTFYGMLAAIVGSRLAYVAVNFTEFREDPLRIVLPIQDGTFRLTGLVMNGGVILAALVIWLYARRYRMPVLKTMDVAAPSLALGLFFTRIGCFLNGCCYGRPTNLPWGAVFPPDSPAGQYQWHELAVFSPLHPAQLYSAVHGLALLAALLFLERRYQRFDGFTAALLFLLYPAGRFAIEFYRVYYDDTGQWLGLTHNHYTSILMILASGIGLRVLARRSRTLSPPAQASAAGPAAADKLRPAA
jgi:phosphatidylglycerol:prolipoprotein diacylglycerol transferase